jgi:hypothetical protein
MLIVNGRCELDERMGDDKSGQLGENPKKLLVSFLLALFV